MMDCGKCEKCGGKMKEGVNCVDCWTVEGWRYMRNSFVLVCEACGNSIPVQAHAEMAKVGGVVNGA